MFENLSKSIFDHKNNSSYIEGAHIGLSKELIYQISKDKDEPKWMLDFRLKSLDLFYEKAMLSFGPSLKNLNLEEILYYVQPGTKMTSDWEEVPEDIKATFDKLGIPEAERTMLAGVGAQYESEMVYHSLKEKWEKQGVIFEDMDQALKKYPDLVKKYFMKCVPNSDHKFAALHGAVWSGGTFLYVPKNVILDEPVQAYFRMNAPGVGQFEHTLIIIEEGAEVHYIEGCSAPKYGKNALHAGCVEVFLGENSKARYSSVENWSKDTYNLNTKRAICDANARMEWVGGNMGSNTTMLYPCTILKGNGSSCDHLGVTFANKGQYQDVGAKVFHIGKNTSSKIISKSISKEGGISSYRGIVKILPSAENSISNVVCDALILDDRSNADAIPLIDVQNNSTSLTHEATAGKISEEDIFYLTSRGFSEEQAMSALVNGFISPIVRTLPLEYAVEMNRLIEIEIED